jgi:hypothetical protein
VQGGFAGERSILVSFTFCEGGGKTSLQGLPKAIVFVSLPVSGTLCIKGEAMSRMIELRDRQSHIR